MKVCTCVLLFGIFAYTHSFASNAPKSSDRSVNLALETVLEFSNKDKEVDIKFLNNVQNFLTKVKTVIDDNSNSNNLRRQFKAPRVKTFTGFIQDVIHIVNTYEDTAFTDFFDILDEEIRNYHYRGCRFYELTENYEIRKLIAAKLDSIKGKPTSVIKAHINALSGMLKDDNYDINVKKIVHYINSLYRQAGENFQKVITDLKAYGRSKSKKSNNHLGKIIKNGVRSIIFDHYTNLNTNVRRDVKEKIETFWKKLKNTKTNVKPYSKSRNNAKNSENTMNGLKKPEPVSRKDLMNIANKKINNKIEVIKTHENNKDRPEIQQSEYKKAEMKRYDAKNEKKRYNNSRQDTVYELLDTQEKEITLSSQHTGSGDQQSIKYKHQEHLNIDSSSGESFSSIEFYHEPQHNTTQYMKIVPVKRSQKQSMNVTKKPGIIEALNVTTRMPKSNPVKKIWIEESTGRLPKAVLDKLAIKPSGNESKPNMTEESLKKHGPKHKKKYDKDQKKWHGKRYTKHGKKYDKKHEKSRMTKHWSKNGTKYESEQKQKSKQDKKHKNDNTAGPNNPFILVHNRDFFRQNYVRTTDSIFNMEVHQYKKSMGPLRVELKQKKRWTTASTKAQKLLEVLDVLMPSKSGKTIKSPQARRTAAPRVKFNEIRRMRQTRQTSLPLPTNSSMGRLAVAVPRVHSKSSKMFSWKSAEHPSSFKEGMAVKNSEIKDDKRHGQIAKITSSSLEIGPQVMKRIKNLERQLNDVESRININTDVVKARKDKLSYAANDEVVKRKQSETEFKSDVINFLNDYKTGQDKSKMAGTADNKTERIIENKNVKGIDSINNEKEDDLEKGKKSEARFRSDVNMIPNNYMDSTGKTKVTEKSDYRTDVNNKDFKNKEEIVYYDYEIEKDTKQQEIINKNNKPEISLTNISDVSSKAKDKGITVTMNDHDGDDASRETGTQNRTIASLSTSTKAIESTTITTTTVPTTVGVTTPTTITLSTISISIPVALSPKLADVFQKAEFNATVAESKNKMANNISQVADVSKTTLNVTKRVTSE